MTIFHKKCKKIWMNLKFLVVLHPMKPAKVYNHYIWIINTLRAYGGLTLAELSEKWQEDKMTDGNGLPRATFNRNLNKSVCLHNL
jgi:hypothetical protein